MPRCLSVLATLGAVVALAVPATSYAAVETARSPRLADTTKPVVHLTLPAKANRSKAWAWKTIRGTITDTGSGPSYVSVGVLEKRGANWYAYNGAVKKWFKAGSTESSAFTSPNFWPITVTPKAGKWATPSIGGITSGTLVVKRFGADKAGNTTSWIRVQQVLKPA